MNFRNNANIEFYTDYCLLKYMRFKSSFLSIKMDQNSPDLQVKWQYILLQFQWIYTVCLQSFSDLMDRDCKTKSQVKYWCTSVPFTTMSMQNWSLTTVCEKKTATNQLWYFCSSDNDWNLTELLMKFCVVQWHFNHKFNAEFYTNDPFENKYASSASFPFTR